MVKAISGADLTTAKYNGDGLRVEKTVNGTACRYLYEYDKIVLETDASGNQTARNVYGTNLLKRQTGGDSFMYMYDGHGDVTALLNQSGAIAVQYYYDAFGVITETTKTGGVVSADNPFLYSGYFYDSETELYYLKSRYYDPAIARFMQEDTYRGSINDPLSLNLYSYANNEPVMYYDPGGHFPLPIIIGISTGIVSNIIGNSGKPSKGGSSNGGVAAGGSSTQTSVFSVIGQALNLAFNLVSETVSSTARAGVFNDALKSSNAFLTPVIVASLSSKPLDYSPYPNTLSNDLKKKLDEALQSYGNDETGRMKQAQLLLKMMGFDTYAGSAPNGKNNGDTSSAIILMQWYSGNTGKNITGVPDDKTLKILKACVDNGIDRDKVLKDMNAYKALYSPPASGATWKVNENGIKMVDTFPGGNSLNGKLKENGVALTQVYVGGNRTGELRYEAAIGWARMYQGAVSENKERLKSEKALLDLSKLEITSPDEAYRTYKVQEVYWNDPYLKGAYPGTSNHGYGLAFDLKLGIGGITGTSSNKITDYEKNKYAESIWLHENEKMYGLERHYYFEADGNVKKHPQGGDWFYEEWHVNYIK